MTQQYSLREGLPPLPAHMRQLPIDRRGYPIPWFVKWIDGVPDFRVLDEAKVLRCLHEKRCQICGGALGRFKAFVGGPLMIQQRVSLEPPMHRDCAEFAIKTCPYMLHAAAKKRLTHLPAEIAEQINVGMVQTDGNPGVFGLHVCLAYSVDTSRGILHMGAPVEPVTWYVGGEVCTDPSVVSAAITRGMQQAQAAWRAR